MTNPARVMREYQSSIIIHSIRAPVPAANFAVNVTWTNMPAAESDMYAGVAQDTLKQWYGASIPLSYNEFGAWGTNIATAGSANAVVAFQYSLDGGVNYSDFVGAGVGGVGNPLSIASTGQKLGKIIIPDSVKALTYCPTRAVGRNGNGIADPVWTLPTGVNSGLWGVHPVNIAIDIDPPIFCSVARRKRQMVFLNIAWSFGTLTWTNMPAALTEWFGVTTRRLTIFFTTPGTEWVKLTFNIRDTGAANAVMMMQYSLDAGASWQFIDSETTNTGAPCNIGATGFRQSASYVKVDAAAKVAAGTLCRLVGRNGDGAADPTFSGGTTGRTMGLRFDPAS